MPNAVRTTDEIAFAVPKEDRVGAEILITRHAVAGAIAISTKRPPISYLAKSKPDKRVEHFVSAEVQAGALGTGTIFLPLEVRLGTRR